MGFMALTKEERKICCRTIDFKLFRKVIKDQIGSRFLYYTKKRVEQFEYIDLLNYVENNLKKEEDDSILGIAASQAAMQLMPSFQSYQSLLKDLTSLGEKVENIEGGKDELPTKSLHQMYFEALEPYRKDYEEANPALSFDSYVLLNTPTLKQETLAYEKQLQEKQDQKDQERKLKEYDELVEAKVALEEQVRTLKSDIKSTLEANTELAMKLSHYQTIFDKDNYRHKLTGILRVSSLISLTDEEIYHRLNDEEQKAMDKEDYERVQVVLAAKYFMMTLKGVD